MTDQNSPGNPTRENTLQIKVWYCIDTINPMVITLGRMPAGVPVLCHGSLFYGCKRRTVLSKRSIVGITLAS